MVSRQQYEEHSERDFLAVPLASYHFDEVLIPLHWHRELELIQTETAGSIELEGQSCPYSAGDILCVNRGILHRTSEPMGKADLLVFHLRILLSPLLEQDASLFLNQLEKGSLLLPVRIGRSEAGYSDLSRGLMDCISCIGTKEPGWELRIQTGLLHLLELFWKNGHLAKTVIRPYNPQAGAVKESITFMNRHFGQDLTIRQLSEQAALSPSHYIRVFRLYTGQTPFAFLNDLRLEKAVACLRQGMTVTETAMQVGISNISYFIRLFCKKYGQTPKQYQLSLSSAD